MVTKAVLVAMIVLASPVGPRAAGTCDVPSDMTTRDKLPCVRASTVLLEQPSLTIEQLTKGPDFEADDPAKSRFAYFTPEDTITCYFRPFFAFLPDKGRTPKFLCWQLDGSGQVLRPDGTDHRSGRCEGGRRPGRARRALRAQRCGQRARNQGRPVQDQVPHPTVSEPRPARQRSVHGSGCGPVSLGARLSSRSHVLRAGGQVHRVQPRSVQGRPAAQHRIAAGTSRWCSESWRSSDCCRWTRSIPSTTKPGPGQTRRRSTPAAGRREQQVGFDAYRLALGLLTYHNPLDSQNRLVCAEWKAGARRSEGVHAADDSRAGPRVVLREARLSRDEPARRLPSLASSDASSPTPIAVS